MSVSNPTRQGELQHSAGLPGPNSDTGDQMHGPLCIIIQFGSVGVQWAKGGQGRFGPQREAMRD